MPSPVSFWHTNSLPTLNAYRSYKVRTQKCFFWQMDIIPDILMAYLASIFSEFHGQISCDESTARMHWVIQPFKLRFSRWPRRNFRRCHGKFEHFGGLILKLPAIWNWAARTGWFLLFFGYFFWGLVILPWSFMGDLYGFATFYRYGWVNRRNSSVNRHACLGIPKGLSSHCFIESLMCIPVSIRNTPISIDVYIYTENYID